MSADKEMSEACKGLLRQAAGKTLLQEGREMLQAGQAELQERLSQRQVEKGTEVQQETVQDEQEVSGIA